jgi:F-type H+-transporting ATPase subunit epsilon
MAASDTDQLQVELVAADRTVWSGQASMVVAKTVDGDLGILRNHAPVLSLLTDGVVEIVPVDGDRMYAAVDGGFLSVAHNRVSILSQFAALSHEINVEEVRAELEAAQSDSEDDTAGERVKRAEARIRAVEKAS